MASQNTTDFDKGLLRALIEEINSTLDVLLDLAMEDFMVVTNSVTLIQQCYNGSIRPLGFSDIIKHLQYYDTFRQKCEHIKDIHNWILDDFTLSNCNQLPLTDPSLNIIRLNQLQFQIANSEYVRAVAEISRLMELISSCTNLTFEKRLFDHTRLILSGKKVIDSKLSYALTKTAARENFCVNRKLTSISGLYSMASERTILAAYLENPKVSLNELKLLKVDEMINIENIDLF